MFKLIKTTADQYITIIIDESVFEVPAGINVAAALLLMSDSPYRRSPITGEARGPHCMIGTCHECLIEIDGKMNQQGCLIMVRPNMKISRQLSLVTVIRGQDNEG